MWERYRAGEGEREEAKSRKQKRDWEGKRGEKKLRSIFFFLFSSLLGVKEKE